jgi:hypothetical protein
MWSRASLCVRGARARARRPPCARVGVTGGYTVLRWRRVHTQVGKLKLQIEAERSLPAATMKLIHAGKVLVDTQTVEEAGVKEGGFLVCMASKKTPVRARARQQL